MTDPAQPVQATPRTDHACFRSQHGDTVVSVEFARSIERELSLAQTENSGHIRIEDELKAEIGGTLAELRTLQARCAELEKDAARFAWWFSDEDKREFMNTYMQGIREHWSLRKWREALDAAISAGKT